ncbi:YbgC/FadM family acyl-CoA thioesterase [Sphingobium subterraneum]|uniref:Acyl-CoA thioester hydrolase n=1 Tax=Sphingobium subterraneum TaxID=627688 RepID=A0A841J848_9SPHN|nr:YbgC/FadM family acyl-CoA thioesterase [Sphingobium subterraneum]MBB6124728.1 acyl-CoA thioester hydrolase [Sphingobium subterraneum]
MNAPSHPDTILSALPQPASGRFLAGVHYFPLRVYFEDTDTGGVVYHANYLRYMERARSDMLRIAGIDQRAALEAGDGVYAVARATIDYRLPAHLDDDLMVVSRVAAVTAATCVIDQQITRGTQQISNGQVTVAFITPGGRPKRQPKHWIATFNRLVQGEDLPV